MTEEFRRKLLIYAFLYLVALVLALLIFDVEAVGVGQEEIGLSSVNIWFRNLFDYGSGPGYSEFLYSLSIILAYVSLAPCALWLVLYVKEHIREKNLSGIGVDKNLMTTFWLYLLSAVLCLVLRLFSINHGPVIIEGEAQSGVSFPSVFVLIYIVAWMSTIFQIRDLLSEKKTLIRVITAVSCVIMGVGIIACLTSGASWLTDVVGGILLGATMVLLSTFFYDL